MTANTELGTTYEEAEAQVDGKEIVISFNPRYLTDALKACEGERVTFRFTTPLSPCILEGNDGSDYKYLILPLRVKG
jgi:DNA polymerase-3 subunit beta